MNIFRYRDELIGDYSEYVNSFIRLRDSRIRSFVDRALESEVLWPDPLIQLNPTFKPGRTVDELCDEKVLHTDCRRIFRRDKQPGVEGGGLPSNSISTRKMPSTLPHSHAATYSLPALHRGRVSPTSSPSLTES